MNKAQKLAELVNPKLKPCGRGVAKGTQKVSSIPQ
jgi:hypothetical protein